MSEPTQPYGNNQGVPGSGEPGSPDTRTGQPQPPAPAPPLPKEVTRAGWLPMISAVLQVAVFALMIASLTGSSSAVPLGLFALAGTWVYLVVVVAVNFFILSGFRFARIIAAGMAAVSLLRTSNSFIFGPAAGVVSLPAVTAWVGAAVLLFQRPANEFFRGSWATRRARLLNHF